MLLSSIHRTLLLAALCGSAVVTAAEAAPSGRMSVEAMWSLARLGDPAISPDGRLAVVPVTRYDVRQNKGRTHLWLFPVAGGPGRQLTAGEVADTSPAWSPDGRAIAFVSKRGDDPDTQVYVIDVDGGEARRVTNVPTGADAPKWFPDGKRLAFVSSIWPDLVRWEDQGRRVEERAKSKMTAKVWTRAPIAYWDHYLDEREPHLFSIPADGSGEPQAITRQSGYSLSKNEYSSSSYDVSPDGLEVAFAANVDRVGNLPNYDVIVVEACGCKPPRNVTADNRGDDGEPLYSPDGRWLAFTQQKIPTYYADRARLLLLDRRGGGLRDLTGDWERSAAGLRWRPDSKAIYGQVDDAATNRVWRFDLATPGRPRPVTAASSFSGLALARGGGAKPAAVAIRQSFSEPPTLVRLDLASGAATALSSFDAATLAAIRQGKVESVRYAGARGREIQMWVVHPPDFDPAKRYPVLMLLHGGPHNTIQDSVQWRWNAQVFASWGYVVTWHNFHGSSGFGHDFADSINPDRITLPYEDTIKAAEWLAAQPWADRERFVAAGASYGGFLASTLLGRPHPFKALVAHGAVYNSFTQIGADYGAEKDRFFEFWERPEEFARYSPHTSAGSFATPTLVIHGQTDLRVPVNHGIELFNTLQKRGVPSKLVYFPDENHWILKPQNSIFWYHTVRDWLATYAPPGGR
ncbi:MAG: S9 family peptidase [Steroidobacteraceae bacterium]|jgi:dipeptidyl aminopeptidase/acylaminoacyl peptidase|nr:S9 family peptidase [Steroidobacteraceae bacterium]